MLRHKLYFDEMGAVERGKEVREVIPRFKPPVVVEVKRGGNLGDLVEKVRKNPSVELRAAVGAGKSTVVPLQLAKALGCLVIHTIPFHVSAESLAVYLMSQDGGDHVVYMDDIESDVPSHGVVIMTNAFFHARFARDKFFGVSGAVLYLDEIHESDAPTAVLRELGQALTMFRSVVKATATADPGLSMKPVLPGVRSEMVFPKRSVTVWSAGDKGVPWSASAIQGNTLIAIDRADVRMRLAQEYADHGFEVRICLSSSTTAYYVETVKRLQDPSGGIVIVMVDYAYRSSLTIPCLSTLIDSCEVAVPDVEDGRPCVRYRPAYDFEVQQFFGRGCRLPGESATMWRSSDPSPRYMCDLENLECDAANLLFRLMGFRPPVRLSGYAYYDGDVPMDIAAAMSADHPLRLCPPESRAPWVNGHMALLQEKKKEADYAYSAPARPRRFRVSCHTVADASRPSSPTPSVPDVHRRTAVDLDAFEEFVSSREASPSPTVYTLKSELPDNLSVFDEDSEYPAFAKPKRVAKRVLDERAAAAAARERAVLGGGKVDAVTSSTLPANGGVVATDSVSSVPCGDLDSVQTSVGSRTARRMHVGVPDAVALHGALHSAVEDRALPDDQMGAYVYYHGMDKAPDRSSFFVRGIDSIYQYCDQHNARVLARALPERDKLWAMRELVTVCNSSTAVAMGIQRLFQEVSSRDPAEWQALVDHQDLMTTMEWMMAQCTDAQLRVRTCRRIMPFFMSYDLDEVPPALQLEQRVMTQMMERFEKVAVKKDPDKAVQYMLQFNERMVEFIPRGLLARERGRHRYQQLE